MESQTKSITMKEADERRGEKRRSGERGREEEKMGRGGRR